MPNIITFTANLLAETTYYVTDLKIGVTSRATDETFQTGGKGINVTKMLQRLQGESIAICFPGGPFGSICEAWLKENYIPYKAFTKGCITRSGSVIRPAGKEETSVLGKDSHVSEESLRYCLEFLDSRKEDFILAICGVIPDWGNSRWDVFRDWIENRPETVSLAIDTYGPGLEWLAKQNPETVKINRQELDTLLEFPTSTWPTEKLLAKASTKIDCPHWIITDANQAIWFKSKGAKPESIVPRSVELVSSTGCGDVFFATLLDCLYNRNGYDLQKAVPLAAEYASRNAASPGIADFEL